LNKELWEQYPQIWRSKSAFFSWIRGGLRRALWMKHPVKLLFMNKHRQRVDNPNPKGKAPTVWGGVCSMCHGTFTQSQLEVDHIEGAGSLKSLDDLQGWVERLVFVAEDDLRFVCKDCNKALSDAQKNGTTYEEAIINKQAIALQKAKKDVAYLREAGVNPASNAKKRKQQLLELLKEER
jgi:hypothetical protein